MLEACLLTVKGLLYVLHADAHCKEISVLKDNYDDDLSIVPRTEWGHNDTVVFSIFLSDESVVVKLSSPVEAIRGYVTIFRIKWKLQILIYYLEFVYPIVACEMVDKTNSTVYTAILLTHNHWSILIWNLA